LLLNQKIQSFRVILFSSNPMSTFQSKTQLLIFIGIFLSWLAVPATAQDEAILYGAVEQTWIAPYPEKPGAKFGATVASTGKIIAVGSPNDSQSFADGNLYAVGSVFVYELQKNGWVQMAQLTPKFPQAGEHFGTAVAIERDTIAVGASGRDFGTERDVGVVYVFVRQGTEWVQQARIESVDGAENDFFGTAVALSADRLIVGADGKDFGPIPDAGKVYTYFRSGGKWIESHSFSANSPFFYGAFGSTLAVDNHKLVVGAPSEMGIGAAYVFYRNGGHWTQTVKLDPPDDKYGDRFGAAVAIDHKTVVVGAPLSDPKTDYGHRINGGAVYVYREKSGTWQQTDKIVPQNGRYFDHFGYSVALEAATLIVGAPETDYSGQANSGNAYMYQRQEGVWNFQTRIVPSMSNPESQYSAGLTLNGGRIVVSKPGPRTQAGKIYIYDIAEGVLPETGFSPKTQLRATHRATSSTAQNDGVRLEIPTLGVEAAIVGVPRTNNDWDVQWLGDQIGYLEGSAYPTWLGNTVLAGHVNRPNGQPGSFSRLTTLKWGDEIVIYANGQPHVYAVREVFQTSPYDLEVLDRSDDYDWLTLITCRQYDPEIETYQERTVVVAVRIK
jgi:LPXTG-site transpeptidase (sortase) family protein